MQEEHNTSSYKKINSNNEELVRITNTSIPYFETVYTNDFSVGHYYLDTFKCTPCSIAINDYLSLDCVKDILGEGYKLVWTSQVSNKKNIYPAKHIYVKQDALLTVTFKRDNKSTKGFSKFGPATLSMDDYDREDTDSEEPSKVHITIYYLNYERGLSIYEAISKHIILNESKSNISLVVSTDRGLTTSPQSIKSDENLNISLNYGDDFLPIHEKIITKLSEKNGKGLVLLHGLPGTGKTNYIKYLCYKLKKEIIFLPPHLAESITSPDFVSFLIDNSNSILVIEDAEKIIFDRESRDSNRQGVSTLLNMTDGLLSDCLSIQIIATFNTSRDKIDKALLRKGRLISEWKFDVLSVENSNKLLKELKKEYTTTVPMTLTDIYNLDESVHTVQEERRSIGFTKH